MGCETCGDKKPACDKGFTKATLEIKNPSQLVEFRKIVVPASLGDDTAVPPVVGKYCNAILYYEANDQVYLYSSDGIPTKITVDVEALKKQIKDLQEGLASEVETRSAADLEIWQEIETIEASSDVVDVVGTYAELQQYDTSKLHDKDLIKVLADETHDDAITYYRWSTSSSSFSYVGAEGPYYTVTETDTLLSGKQDKLIAGTNISIAADGKTISATDTTYTHFTGATALADGTQGLVPGPLAGDEDKVLKGDGTWGDAATNTIFYMNDYPEYTNALYTDDTLTTVAHASDLRAALAAGGVRICQMVSGVASYYYDISGYNTAADNYSIGQYDDSTTVYTFGFDTDTTIEWWKSVSQAKLTAGSNITINGATISATDTTYSVFTGATSSVAGTTGLVPAPTTSDPSKFLKGDGSWDTPTGTTYSAGANIQINGTTISATDTTYSDFTGATSLVAGAHGLVPAPTTSDPDKYLKGDGTWASLPAANNISSNDWSALWQ